MRKAVYAGSFDPITNGHLWMIEQGARLFDHLVVAIGTNPDKRAAYSLEDRLAMLRESVRHLPRVQVGHFERQFLVHYAYAQGAQYILRGIRSEADYEYERGMRNINDDLRPEIVTVFLMPPRQFAEVSSSMVKGLVGSEGWEEIVARYVPEAALRFLVERYRRA